MEVNSVEGSRFENPSRNAISLNTICRCTSLMRKRQSLGPYRRPMPRVLGVSSGFWYFLVVEIPLERHIHEHPRKLRLWEVK